MSVMVTRRQPSVPAWAWMSASLALLLLITVVLWAHFQPDNVREVKSRPVVEVTEVTPPHQPSVESPKVPERVREARVYQDWSQSTDDFKFPEAKKDANPKPENVKRIKIEVPAPGVKKAEAQKQAAAVKEAARESVVPPAPRLRPQATVPASLQYGGTTWRLSGGAVVTEEEVDLSAAGSTADGRGLYTLTGEVSGPSVLFVETSPGSGQYMIYRPG